MEVTRTIESTRELVKAARAGGGKVGFVPTMGALHKGHISLIETALDSCDFVAVSIFVNPSQFAPGEDFEKYPRPVEADLEICRNLGVDLVFTPDADEMYAGENVTWVTVEKLTETLCGRSRPGHFRGVTTVCAKLFNIIGPDLAFFGQKDAQQGIVIKKMVADLNMPFEIVICPTVREPDGLAVSSRNKYLSPEQRKDAVLIYKSLQKAREMLAGGVKDAETIIAQMRSILASNPSINIEYISIVDTEMLRDMPRITKKALIAVAVRIGSTRLIDNILVDAGGQ